MLPELNAEKGFVFRITHRRNLPWLLDNGLHCRRSPKQDPDFVSIGNKELIEKRHLRSIGQPPGGTLSDYVPFYFTPLSIMAFNIQTGRNGVDKLSGAELLILVTSLHKLKNDGIAFLFTDRQASMVGAMFTDDIGRLDQVDWRILQNKDFSRDNEDIGKTSRYQAEVLVHKHLSADSLLGIACYDVEQKAWAANLVAERTLNLPVFVKRGWYF